MSDRFVARDTQSFNELLRRLKVGTCYDIEVQEGFLIDDAKFKEFCTLLEKSRKVSKICVSSPYILGAARISDFMLAIKNSRSIQHVILNSDAITDYHSDLIVDSVISNPSIVAVQIGRALTKACEDSVFSRISSKDTIVILQPNVIRPSHANSIIIDHSGSPPSVTKNYLKVRELAIRLLSSPHSLNKAECEDLDKLAPAVFYLGKSLAEQVARSVNSTHAGFIITKSSTSNRGHEGSEVTDEYKDWASNERYLKYVSYAFKEAKKCAAAYGVKITDFPVLELADDQKSRGGNSPS